MGVSIPSHPTLNRRLPGTPKMLSGKPYNAAVKIAKVLGVSVS
jgi:hypothetical protein